MSSEGSYKDSKIKRECRFRTAGPGMIHGIKN
jgi:hypothetical protein